MFRYGARVGPEAKERYVGRLDGKVAMVTGGARGQGEAEVRLFAAEGARVVVSDVLVEEGETLAKELGENVAFTRHDVSSEEEWEAAVAFTLERFGSWNVLVNNAGISYGAPIAKHSLESYELLVAVNQIGVFLGIRAAVAPMTDAGGGSIVNISSGAGLRATKYILGYAATKYAVTGMTACAALELARNGIRVNSIHPGVIDTPMIAGSTPEMTAAMVKATPLRRFGQPVEIAQVALFLASDESSYMTGAHVPVDGGLTV
jgi:3alpha(or 20beta)-hydroxysteroid dehydrogenase